MQIVQSTSLTFWVNEGGKKRPAAGSKWVAIFSLWFLYSNVISSNVGFKVHESILQSMEITVAKTSTGKFHGLWSKSHDSFDRMYSTDSRFGSIINSIQSLSIGHTVNLLHVHIIFFFLIRLMLKLEIASIKIPIKIINQRFDWVEFAFAFQHCSPICA